MSVVNRTMISLISKVSSPERISQFRPIGLCNVCYKIMSKIIVHRIRLLLEDLIGEEQASFVPSRQIAYDIEIVQEVMHFIR